MFHETLRRRSKHGQRCTSPRASFCEASPFPKHCGVSAKAADYFRAKCLHRAHPCAHFRGDCGHGFRKCLHSCAKRQHCGAQCPYCYQKYRPFRAECPHFQRKGHPLGFARATPALARMPISPARLPRCKKCAHFSPTRRSRWLRELHSYHTSRSFCVSCRFSLQTTTPTNKNTPIWQKT